MPIKNHSGKTEEILTWENVDGLLEIRVVDSNDDLLWYLVEDTCDEVIEMDWLIEGRFYVPVYFRDWGQSFFKTAKVLLFIIDADLTTERTTKFLEIGEDGYIDVQEFPSEQLVHDLNDGHLLPMVRADDGPEALETDPILQRFKNR